VTASVGAIYGHASIAVTTKKHTQRATVTGTATPALATPKPTRARAGQPPTMLPARPGG
jgi:hypothetical protein